MDILRIILESGIVVKFVLLLLIGLSVISWAIVFYYYKVYKKLDDLNSKFFESYSHFEMIDIPSLRNFDEKIEELKESPFYSIWKNVFKELMKVNDKVTMKSGATLEHYLANSDLSNFERSITKGSNTALKMVDKHRAMLASIATVTPFVGLFGTVWGIIDSFNGLSSGGGTIESVAPGIAEALVATAVGLGAAIPASWFYNIFSKKLQNLKVDMNSFSQDLLNILKRYSIG
ncbi:MAG: MotA/TolQ/ExbB proton channel family protein [Halobacteriovoraceae bacterium]|nr:MotA/TolQ/ExbB proton channel family protein [Halobacteriovoraceae bacterium]MCB9093983.1 MotA/TolQ/ExbB proton channel family protein [Halobacteriovoraceae bacterium]